MRTNLNELLTAIVADAEEQNMGVVLDKLQNFTGVGKEDNESIADIETTLKTYLEVFSYPELQWTLHGNPNKTSPAVLNDGKTNLDLAIHESMLVTYQPFFRLVTMQILRHCESEFSEYDNRYTMLIFDEAARIGQINGLDAAMSTLRSKHTALVCLFQSISQFKDIYPKEKAQTLLNLCELKLFLSGSGDKDSTDYVSGMVGQYDVKPVALTNDIVDALYKVSKGIVDQLIGVYSCMHYDYLDRKKKPVINADYVYKIANKFYPGIQDILANMESLENTDKIRQIRSQAETTIQETIDKVSQEEASKTILTSQKTITNNQIQLRSVAATIRMLYDNFTDSQIETAFNKLMSRKSSTTKSEKEICRDIIEYLQKTPKRKVSDAAIIKPDLMHMPDTLGMEHV